VPRLIARRLVHIVLVLLLVSFALTFLIDLTPGDPAFSVLGEQATPEQVEQVHKDLHLDDSVPSRYWRWLQDIMQGNFGTSYVSKRPVIDSIMEALPATLELVVLTMLVSLAVAIPIGVYTAYRPDGRFDRFWTLFSSLFISLPGFVVALVLVYFFALLMQDLPIHFPPTGWARLSESPGENLWYITLPVLALSLQQIPQYSRLLRADMLATLQEDYILAARAKGVSTRKILFRHALRPSSFSLVTLAGVNLGHLISGAVIIETLFALPGLGSLSVNSVFSKDVAVVQGVVMLVAIVYVVVNNLVDVTYGYLDPRVRVRRSGA
jgi:peptide/nickel transport system permease protein